MPGTTSKPRHSWSPAAGLDREFTLTDPQAKAPGRKQQWHIPSRAECMVCHTEAGGFALGVNTLQMNKEHNYGSAIDNQLRTLEHLGVFRGPKDTTQLPKPPEKLGRLVSPADEKADLTLRARSYLHANCAHCHSFNGGGNALMELGLHEG